MTTTANGLISKLTAIFITSLFILLSTSAVFAQGATSSTTIRDRIGTRNEAVETRLTNLRERIATKEAALKTRLATFRNKQKARIAERINTTLANINQKIATAMNRHLEVMSGILDKLEARVNAGTADIKDPAAVRTAIARARDAIASASAEVNTQKELDYVLEATSEATIREDMRSVKEKLHNDLKAIRQLVIDAKQKVANAIRIAKSNAGGVSNGQ